MNPEDFKHSYSTLSSFDTCELAFAHKSVWKTIKFTPNSAAQWGSDCHAQLEAKIKHNAPLEGRFSFLAPIAESVLLAADGAPIEAEKGLGIDSNLNPASFFDGKLRGKLDFFYKPRPDRGVIGDYKVADPKYKSKYNLETDVFSFLVMCNDPEIDKIKSVLLWCKMDMPAEPTVKYLSRKDLPMLQDMIFTKMQRVEEAIAADEFRPKKSGLCQKYCDVLSCKFNGRNK